MIIINEHKKDDQVDVDGDGVADATQMKGRDLIKRKVKLVLTKMNPEKVNDAISSIYKGMYFICDRDRIQLMVLYHRSSTTYASPFL